MKKNLNQILDREERLDVLLEVSQFLKDRAPNFNRTAVNVSRSYWWKNVKLIVVIVVVVLIIVLIIILLATRVIPVSAPVGPVVTPTTKP
ncbi:hypothetical protein CRENBAI_005946 [Crenichthys baileyi]|uniref:V-SNARE coiled-coil homology domain-containing protein n=1 Tax=Crenichthys baileyi TaxID=28760 RepID=A0AAV9SLZ9_9TELE